MTIYQVEPPIFDLWDANRTLIGEPTSIEYDVVGGRKQRFVNGDCYWSPLIGTDRASFIKGRIKETYDKARGSITLGVPGPSPFEYKSPTYPSTYRQECASGMVWWSKADGGKAVSQSKTPRLRGANNFRDMAGEGAGIPLGVLTNVRRGFAFRANSISSTSGMDRFILQSLRIRTIVRFNSGGDPTIPGITNVYYPMTNEGDKLPMYRRYVTDSGNRSSVGKTLNKIAASSYPVLYHCSQGKDRTGWVSAMIQMALGVSAANVMAEYLKSNTYQGTTGVRKEYLQAGLDQMKSSYGTVDKYLAACGVTDASLGLLRTKLVV